MKKIAFILIVTLAASLTMAGSGSSEKLKYDDNGWDNQWDFTYDDGGKFTLEVNMLVHHGIATAGAKNGKFTIDVNASGVNVEGNDWDSNPLTFEDNEWDRESPYVPITGILEWNGDDDGSGEITSIAITLMSPGGKAVGSTAFEKFDDGLFFYGPKYEAPPGCPSDVYCP